MPSPSHNHIFAISIPVGAYHPFLSSCFECLAHQKNDGLEVALMDASNDPRVSALADQYADLFAYRRHGPDQGQSDAIAEGWQHLSGDILGWLNADDCLFPDAITKAQTAFAADPSLDLVYGHSAIIDEDKAWCGYHWAVERPSPRILEAGIISQPSCFFKRQAYEAIGGINRDLHYTMDWDLWMRLYKSGTRFGFIDDVLSTVLWGGDTKTSSFTPQRRAELKQLISENAPPEIAKKTFRSFAIHHALENLPTAWLRKKITRHLIKGRAEIFGISGDGQLTNGAKLSMVHFDANPKNGVRLEIENNQNIENFTLSGTGLKNSARNGREVDLEFSAPLRAGELLTIDCAVAPKKTYFERATWTS